jgi:cyclopropane fatty-acyl-phospholipid synthase-like methyltransferase
MTAWDKIFEESGRVFKEPHPKMDVLVKLFRKNHVKKVLDLGCGSGRHLIYFASEGFDIYGFDSSPNALKLARKWLDERNLNVQIYLHRMEKKFPFKTDFFDAIISIQVIHHNKLEVIRKSVSEIERVLKNGGIIFISFPVLKKFSHKNQWKLKEIEKGTYIPLDGPEKDLPHHFFSKEEIFNIFNKFKILDMGPDGTNHEFILAKKYKK